MTRVGYGDLLGIPSARWGKGAGGVPWLLRATFGGGDQSAPLSSPLGAPAVEVGSLTLVNDSSNVSISDNELLITNAASRTVLVRSDNFDRTAGRALIISAGVVSGTNNAVETGYLNTSNAFLAFIAPRSGSDFVSYNGPGAFVELSDSVSSAENDYAIVLRTAGAFMFAIVSGTWRLLWLDAVLNTTPIRYAFWPWINSGSTHVVSAAAVGVRDLPAPFDTDYGIASQNIASPVSGTSYTVTADAITDLTLTAPNPLADQAGYRYRYTDDDNCWHSYLNSAGAYRLDSVAASTATNRINVAAVIAAGETRTIRTISNGSLHNAYTLAATTWTKRGSQINVSHLNTNTAIRPYTTGSWAMSNLRSYPTTDPRYDAELNKT